MIKNVMTCTFRNKVSVRENFLSALTANGFKYGAPVIKGGKVSVPVYATSRQEAQVWDLYFGAVDKAFS
jgi:hypothetical protein